MKKNVKKILSILLIVAMVLQTMLITTPVSAAEPSGVTVKYAGGWNETLYLQASGVKDADVTAVSYDGPTRGSLTGDDFKYLVRDCDGELRIDIPGLKPGTYSITVTTTKGTITRNDIVVEAQDRSGYAHYNYTAGVGAYNDDGTLKSNAIVIYVTEENKDKVSVTSKDGTTVTGIGHILNSSGRDNGNGLTPKGGKPNKNNSIMRRLADDGTPLVVRIIGNVSAPDGVTAKASLDYGGFLKDNGSMAAIQSGKDVTIEGVGYDATINGWGIHFMCQSDYPNYGKSFEVRNLSFENVPEDCIGMDGVRDGLNLKYPVERIWIHHCTFNVPTIENPADGDKANGDGACDFKKGQYFTNSYCYYNGYNKTNLLGGDDTNVQYNLTYHHNYWKNCSQRMPLARHANIHMYNNYFYGASTRCMDVRMDAYIFSEYSIFEKCANPVAITRGVVKSYNDTFTSCSGTNGAQKVSSKSTTISSDNKYANFDTNSSLSYIPSGKYLLHTDKSTLKNTIVALAGAMGKDDLTLSGNSGSEATTQAPSQATTQAPSQGTTKPTTTPTQSASDQESSSANGGNTDVTGSEVQDFTKNGKTSGFYSITGNLSKDKGSVAYAGKTLTQCLKMESSTSITFTAPAKGKLTLVFGGTTSASGKSVKVNGTSYKCDSSSIVTVDVSSGSVSIVKGDSINLFYMVYTPENTGSGDVHTHSYSSSVTKAPTCTEAGVRTYICSCGTSYTETIVATGHTHTSTVTKTPTCTETGVRTYTCSCGDTYTETIAATGHTYSTEFTIDKAATATEAGSKSRHCLYCEAKTDVTVIPATGTTSDLNGLNKVDGVWGYYVDGVLDTSYTGLADNSSGTWYVQNGVVSLSYNGNVTINGVIYKVSGSKVTGTGSTTTTKELKKVNGIWGYYVNGSLDTSYTGLAENSSGTWYVVNGIVSLFYNGNVVIDGVTYKVVGSKVTINATGTLQKVNGVWGYYVNGKINTSYTGLAENSSGTWYVVKGIVSLSYNGNVTIDGVTYKVSGSKVTGTAPAAPELKKVDGVWGCYVNGKLDTSYTGLAENSSGTWYVVKGIVSLSYNGNVTIDGVIYKVSGSKVEGTASEAPELKKVGGVWSYCVNGKVDTSYTGLAENSSGIWYVEKGVVSLKYTGVVVVNGKLYTVVNSKVQ